MKRMCTTQLLFLVNIIAIVVIPGAAEATPFRLPKIRTQMAHSSSPARPVAPPAPARQQPWPPTNAARPNWPQPMSVAPANRPIPTLPLVAAPTQKWIEELPSLSAVRNAFQTANEQQTETDITAALTVLYKYYIPAMSGVASQFDTDRMPPAAAAKLREYSDPPPAPKANAATMNNGYIEAESYEFQRMALTKLVPLESSHVYWSTPRASQFRMRFVPRGQSLDAEEQQISRISEVNQNLAAQLEKDRVDAGQQHIDLTAFGIKLGEPLTMPQCPTNTSPSFSEVLGVGQGAAVQCQGDPTAELMMGIAAVALDAARIQSTLPEGVSLVSVRLASANCPAWVRAGGNCVAFVAVGAGIALAVNVQVGNSNLQGDIVSAINAKYGGRPPALRNDFECRNNLTGIVTATAKGRSWTLPGLEVAYEPIQSDCRFGLVKVQLGAYRKLDLGAQGQREVTGPKM